MTRAAPRSRSRSPRAKSCTTSARPRRSATGRANEGGCCGRRSSADDRAQNGRVVLMAERLIGMLIFPRLTQLDMTGPYEVLARLPNTKVHLVAHTMAPVKTDRGMEIVPTVTIADCPPLDLVMVPGGPGQQDLMEDEVALEFLRKQAADAKYVTSVCTGSLVLGAAGLLMGKRATSHWAAIDHLKALGAIPVNQRVVMDGNVITGA